MRTKTNYKQSSVRIENVLNTVLVAVLVGSVGWAAIYPSVAPLFTG